MSALATAGAPPTREVFPDSDQMQAHFLALHRPGEVREVRILNYVPPSGFGGPSTASGYFENAEALAAALRGISSQHATGIYITQNPVDPDLLARAKNRLIRRPKQTTTDADIIRLAHLTLDFDPVRKAGISATDDELRQALAQRDAFIQFVTAELGWPDPVISMMSGNGGQATWRIDLTVDVASTALVRAVLESSSALFSTITVSVDTTLSNPSRIVKLSGTVAAKGDALPHRPHRRARSVFCLDTGVVLETHLRALVAVAPEPHPHTRPVSGRPPNAGTNAPSYDVPALLDAAGIGFRERAKGWGRVFELDQCLSSDDHTDGAAIFQFPSGAVAYHCFHNRCAGITWHDVKPRLGISTSPNGYGAAGNGAGGYGGVASGNFVSGPHELPPHAQDWPETAPLPAQTESLGTRAKGRVHFMTAREFAQQTPAVTEWVLEPWVPVGGITKIDGAPKKAGKTTLITHMVAAVLNGADFLGKPTRKGPVVLLTEQGSTSFRESLARAGLLECDDLHIATYRDFVFLDWSKVVAQAFDLAQDVGAVLLVVDTLPACAGVRGDDENSAGRALAVMEPIQIGADTYGVGVLISFHDRKDGGEVGVSGRGSSAYTGAVDTVLRLTRPGGNLKPTIRKIEALSRFEATPAELYIELTDAGYVSLGSDADIVSAAVARTLADVLPVTQETAIPIETRTLDGQVVEQGIRDSLAEAGVKAARSTLDAEIERWREAGYVGRGGEGKRGSAYRYWLVAQPPPDFLRSIPPDPSEERIDPPGAPANSRREKDSSDVQTPSEENNSGAWEDEADEGILPSDAPGGYSGSNSWPVHELSTTWEEL